MTISAEEQAIQLAHQLVIQSALKQCKKAWQKK